MDDGVEQQRPIVLVMEQDHLLRWSLTTYLGRFFTVFAIGSLDEMSKTLNAQFFDAIVASDDLAQDAETLCTLIRKNNPAVVAVQMVAAASGANVAASFLPIDKPFQLSALVDLISAALEGGCQAQNHR